MSGGPGTAVPRPLVRCVLVGWQATLELLSRDYDAKGAAFLFLDTAALR